MRLNTIPGTGLAAFLIVSLGGCATNGNRPDPVTCALVGGALGGVVGGTAGYVYSDHNRQHDTNQLEGAAIGLASTAAAAGVGYLICSMMEEEPKPEPRRAAPTPPPPKPAPPPKPSVCTSVTRLEGVQFGNDKSDITPTAATSLDETAELLQLCPEKQVRLNAYTDSAGSDAYNLKLSQRRADSVRAYLIEHGVSASRIEAKGLGESNPVASNDTPEGRAQNRRVEIEPIL